MNRYRATSKEGLDTLLDEYKTTTAEDTAGAVGDATAAAAVEA